MIMHLTDLKYSYRGAMRFRTLVLTVLLTLCGLVEMSAQVSVENHIDVVEMMIGDQTDLTITVTAKEDARVEIPRISPSGMLVPNVEVVDCSEMKTTPKGDGTAEFQRKYRITSFEDTLYYLPPMKVMVDGKEYAGKELALKVFTFEVDTTKLDEFFPPKDVQDNPFLWSEWQPVFIASVVMVLLLVLTLYLFICLRSNKPVIRTIRVVKKVLPHQKAMKAIESIKADRMVDSGDPKEYYTRLTDALRRYINERYGFSATEMTSQEIIDHLASQDTEALEELRTLFTTADLVKFAKHSTLINENDMNLVNAIEFINSTKIENLPTEEKILPQLTEEEIRRQGRRIGLIVAICVAAAVCAGLFSYVVIETISLMV